MGVCDGVVLLIGRKEGRLGISPERGTRLRKYLLLSCSLSGIAFAFTIYPVVLK